VSYAERELRGQFDALEATTRHIVGRRAELEEALSRVESLWVLGCGSSYSVAKSSARQFSQRCGIPAQAVAAGDLLVTFDAYEKALAGGTLLLLSRSGSTSELLAAARRCRESYPDMPIISICAVDGAPVAELATVSIELPWAFDESVCQTRTVSNLYGAALLLAAVKSGDEGLLADFGELRGKSVGFCAEVEQAIDRLAAAPWTDAVVLADSGMAGLGEEAALAFKEICRTPSNFYHLLDVRHGPMVLIDSDTLGAVLVSRGDRGLQDDLLADLRAKAGTVVAFVCEGTAEQPSITLPATRNDDVSALFMLYCLQLLCVKRAVLNGLDPDRPDGLAAWIELA
jgi:glucosamine--fructose-6-phosphate aminotransferase (isomerizing)